MIRINQLESTNWGSAKARAGKGRWVDIDMQDRLTLQGLDFNSKSVKQGLGLEFQGPLQGMWLLVASPQYVDSSRCRRKYNQFLYLSGSRFSLLLFLTLPRVVPNVWYFLYFMGATSTNSLRIKLQPKIYDHIMLTVRISFILSVCSQVPVIVICLPEPRDLSVESFTNNRHFLMVFPLLTTAFSTPLDIWCQIVAHFLISSIIELTIFVAWIVQVRKEAGRVE
ncbi:hypothetical protein VNO80_26889 [Phaseolus coccineus]|uniref:Transport membrane protein n=1 Tax=Phaseolus coccineus TaxID=3886 RepID=A0AAN9LFU8_PHACN